MQSPGCATAGLQQNVRILDNVRPTSSVNRTLDYATLNDGRATCERRRSSELQLHVRQAETVRRYTVADAIKCVRLNEISFV